MNKNCGNCKTWYSFDFDMECPVYRAQLNDMNNKLDALNKKKEKNTKKAIGATLRIKGLSILTEACNKWEEHKIS